jgi:hypothetical protein
MDCIQQLLEKVKMVFLFFALVFLNDYIIYIHSTILC